MTDPLQAVDLHLALDVLSHVAAQVTLDRDVLVDVGAKLVDVGLGEVLDADDSSTPVAAQVCSAIVVPTPKM